MEYIFDGEIHILDDNLAYAILLKPYNNQEEIYNDKKLFIEKYFNYIQKTDPEKLMKMTLSFFYGFTDLEEVDFIFRSKETTNLLNYKGSFAMKFKRSKNDNGFFNEKMV